MADTKSVDKRASAASDVPPSGQDASGRSLLHAITEPDHLPESEQGALLRVAAAAAGAQDLEEVLELAAEEALAAVGAASLSVSRWDRGEGVLRTLINVGELGQGEERFPEDERYPVAEHPLLQRMLAQGQPYFNAVDDPSADQAAVRLLRSLGKESDVAVPIVTEGEIWGEVWASRGPGQPRFRGTDVRFLEAIAGQLALAISRAELFSRVSRLAYEDPLTGLANRRAIEERLDRATARAASGGGAPVTVLLCDVDNLKGLNDSRGHDAGDRALARVGEALVGAAAGLPGSLVGRLSGDEFCVIIEGAGLDAGRELALLALAALGSERDIPVSLSCGASASGPGTSTPDQLLRAADAAQYVAKRRGGGQFCTAEAGFVPEGPARERRLFRGSAAERVRAAAASAVGLLDGELVRHPALDRLEAVTTALAEAVNAAAWAISFSEPGAGEIRSICTGPNRDTRLLGLRVGLEQEVYPLNAYPATARLVKAGSGSYLVERADRSADAAERELLMEEGHEAVLGVAAAAADGTYLVELYADRATAPLGEAELELRLLTRAAIPPGSAAGGDADRLRRRTRQLELTSSLGARLAGATENEEIVRITVMELRELGYAVCAVVRLEDGMLRVMAEGETGGPGRWGNWSAPATSGLIGRALTERRSVCVGDVKTEPAYRAADSTQDIRSELDIPIRVAGRPWGVITVQEKLVDAFSEDDVKLLETVADLLGSALHSAALYGRLDGAYLGTAEALSAALEARDAYTASHSASVVRRAIAVGEQLGMSGAELRTLRYGATFHDIGKLAVPEAILAKPGPLTPGERCAIEQHTAAGERILSPVGFLADVLPLVRHAHERWDGRGYPDGLAGEEIPLGARIIFACDAYHAMTSDRPYREGMSPTAAREELERCAGHQFDPDVVSALLEVLGQDEAPS